MRFLQFLRFDSLSFLSGLIAGALLAWLAGRFRRFSSRLNPQQQRLSAKTQGSALKDAELHFRNDTLRYAQTLHLASPLFALDEILIPSLALVPPPLFDPEIAVSYDEFSPAALPFLPDWPELGSTYGNWRVTVEEALTGGAHLAISGGVGVGKTVALACLASRLARREVGAGVHPESIPLLINATDLLSAPSEDEQPIDRLVSAVSLHTPSIPASRLRTLLTQVLEEGRAVLLLDGLDELPPTKIQTAVAFLERLLNTHPGLRIITTVSPDYYAGLPGLGFTILPLAVWDESQIRAFIQTWGERWRVGLGDQRQAPLIDPALLDAWLVQNISQSPSPMTPLELTLKTWAAHAGDQLGPTGVDNLEAYVRRTITGLSDVRPGLVELAAQACLGGLDRSDQQSQLQFAHPAIAGYLAAVNPPEGLLEQLLASDGSWAGKTAFLHYLAAVQKDGEWAQAFLDHSSPPLQRNLLYTAHWLDVAPQEAAWRNSALRWLSLLIKNESAPFGLRLRAMVAIALSGSEGVSTLFRGFLKAPEAMQRRLGALGAGLLKDAKLLDELQGLLADVSLEVRRAACLALASLGDQPAIDAVATTLLHGDEATRRAAAEALANNPQEGYQLLREGSEMKELPVRRAVVYGLKRIRKPWATELLKKIQTEDSEWVVKNTAAQALEEIEKDGQRLPHSPPPLSDMPWLIAFASRQGMGVAPGRPATNLLLLALQDGAEEDRLAAMDALRFYGDSFHNTPVVQVLTGILSSGSPGLQAAAYETLLHLSALGYAI